ncbi:MAG TPA: DUF2484 family protein [Paracoccaceae bacterium]|nr:DUF2484 family protein [Paracoccaceae bacterium]
MSTPLIAAIVWALAATATAFLPMRRQMVPGIALLISAPVLIVWIGLAHGWLWGVGGLLAFLSMFRNPLIYFARRALGRPAPLPPELERRP